MRIIVILLSLLTILSVPVFAQDITPPKVPKDGEIYMPEDTESFGDGLWHIVKVAMSKLEPSLAEAGKTCAGVIAITLLLSVINSFSGETKNIVNMAGTVAIGIVLIQSTNSLLHLAITTIDSISGYSKLFLPIITTAVAAQGGITTATALYTGTSIFCTFLTTLISKVIVPIVYVFTAICIANSSVDNHLLSNLKKFLKWLITWSLKVVIYVFTAYISITGVISGSADATAIKATKIALSGVVPVVGSIIADTSETLLISASTVKNTVGIYGLLAILAVSIGPFLQIAVQSILLKGTAAVCRMFDSKQAVGLVSDFSDVMALLLAMTGTICLFLLISTVCFMKGVPV
ncbi:MAG: stage III sporulation protein AE [Oscillospiraceae bacterium]|nr:stage III sporulation protein AE [Oscillospiraceae bacterium]